MKNIIDIICNSLYVLLFLFQFVLISCNTNESINIDDNNFSSQADTSIYLETFPSNVYLELGRSALIENGKSIFRFVSVLESNENNSLIRLEIEYENGVIKTVDLNTNDIPQTYSLENGFYYNIHLKELSLTNNKFQIMFIYNKYAKL